jgi:hypothetical protein
VTIGDNRSARVGLSGTVRVTGVQQHDLTTDTRA